ncbi:Lcl2p Ecym_4275 [Eremothecium cymbalariae DBVPG|uniref:Long chronological lifespan protein 2 n=1 Tax=Eremothecium cymbalariae (strain CBS 270.75 / DBVPG 7215 / KCTC 17166 / NRRL Y-17582) TaxID=931890 RepID=G8JTI6_ERECY|nr:hypothetical protein Ecym_4275 [Eremothecium cymbalariae DBVPG\
MLPQLLFLVLLSPIQAFFFDFGHGQQQQQEAQTNVGYEDAILNQECATYVCPVTRECVPNPAACPCPYPKTQMKCVLPNGQFVCISKPATHDEQLNQVYDDPVKGPKARNKGVRDCGWVQSAYKGLV